MKGKIVYIKVRYGTIVHMIWNNLIIVNYSFCFNYKVVKAFFFFFF